MKIEAKVFKINDVGAPTLKALANITIDDSLVITGIKLIDGKNGLFMSMPNFKTKEGTYKDIAFPRTKEARQQIIDAIMEKYEEKEIKNEELISDDDLPF